MGGILLIVSEFLFQKPLWSMRECERSITYESHTRLDYSKAEIVETTLVISSRFRFLTVGSCTSELRVIILPEMQILKVGSRISDLSGFRFLFLNFHVTPSCFKRLGTIRTEKKQILWQIKKGILVRY